MYIRTRIQSRTAPRLDKLAAMTQDEASKYGPYGKNDSRCTVECGGKRIDWKSRRAARFFYSVAAVSCEGSAKERYSTIVAELDAGKEVATDGIPVMPVRNEPVRRDIEQALRGLRIKAKAVEIIIDECRRNGMDETADRLAAELTDLSQKMRNLKNLR